MGGHRAGRRDGDLHGPGAERLPAPDGGRGRQSRRADGSRTQTWSARIAGCIGCRGARGPDADARLFLRRHRPDGLRHAGGAGRHGGGVVPRQGRADADRRPRRDRPRLRAGSASVLLWGRNASSFGLVRADNFGLFITITLCIVGLLTIAFSGQTIRREGLPAGEYYTLMLFADRGHDDDGDGHGSADDLPGARDPVDCGLRADRASPRLAAVHRGGVQVLPARRVRQRVLPLRHGADLHADRLHAARSHRHVDGGRGHARHADDAGRGRACCWSASRSRFRRCRSTCGRRTPTRARRPW